MYTLLTYFRPPYFRNAYQCFVCSQTPPPTRMWETLKHPTVNILIIWLKLVHPSHLRPPYMRNSYQWCVLSRSRCSPRHLRWLSLAVGYFAKVLGVNLGASSAWLVHQPGVEHVSALRNTTLTHTTLKGAPELVWCPEVGLVCMYVCTGVCMYVCMRVWICMCGCMYVCTYVVRTYVCVCSSTYHVVICSST